MAPFLLITAHVKVCHLAYYDISKPYGYRIGLCICSFIIVYFTIEHQVYHDWKFKEQHAKIWENIVGAKRYSLPRGFNIAGASASVAAGIPTPLHC